MNATEKLKNLQSRISNQVDPEESKDWWRLWQSIEFDLDGDPNLTDQEKELVARSKHSLSQAISGISDGNKFVNTTGVSVNLNGLQASLERRTTGVDGWPIKYD